MPIVSLDVLGRDRPKFPFITGFRELASCSWDVVTELAIDQVKRLLAAGARVPWTTADQVYGHCGEFRGALRGTVACPRRHRPRDQRVAPARAS